MNIDIQNVNVYVNKHQKLTKNVNVYETLTILSPKHTFLAPKCQFVINIDPKIDVNICVIFVKIDIKIDMIAWSQKILVYYILHISCPPHGKADLPKHLLVPRAWACL